MIRTLLERFSRNRVIKRRLPKQFGRRSLYVTPDSALSYLKPDLSSVAHDLFEAARRFLSPGDNVWDIGGNVGAFTLSAAHQVGREGSVLAVEADAFLASLLQRTVSHPGNQDLNILVFCSAVSDQVGVSRFAIASRGRSSNALEAAAGRSTTGGVRLVQHVPSTTLDVLLDHFNAPQFIKIDVEGAEMMVLEGATHLLQQCRPVIYIEVGGIHSEAVTAFFKRNRYRIYNGDLTDGIEIERCCFNTLAVPIERQITNAGL